MSRPIRLTRLAEEDLRQARRWYLVEAPHMESVLEEELRRAFRHIADRPRLYQQVEKDVHRATLSRFPFSIYYRQVSRWIEVIAVLHQARDPRTLQQRLK